MIDPAELWDFDDAEASATRFRDAAATAEGIDRLVLLSQVARALGLQGRYDEGHAVLDDLATNDAEVATRVALERGRLLRSAGSPDAARPHFEAAAATAGANGLDALQVDALHMVALVAGPRDQVRLTEEALSRARSSGDEQARNWDAALLNNLGMAHADAGDFASALTRFEEALTAAERIGDSRRIRVARWAVGWGLRKVGRLEEALVIQRTLQADLAAAGLSDPYVEEEIGLLGG